MTPESNLLQNCQELQNILYSFYKLYEQRRISNGVPPREARIGAEYLTQSVETQMKQTIKNIIIAQNIDMKYAIDLFEDELAFSRERS